MRKFKWLFIVAVLFILYLGSWYLFPVKELPLLVVSKTVPDTSYREHSSLFWLLEHHRITSEGEFLKAEQDYLGYHPPVGGREERQDTLKSENLEGIRLLYLADAYGVYTYEEGYETYERKLPEEHQPVSLRYGGLSAAEVEVIGSFAEQEAAILVGEFNIFNYPTYLDRDASQSLQSFFGVRGTGWSGKYYTDLREAAYNLKELYSRVYARDWDFHGEGMVLVRDDVPQWEWYSDILVLTSRDMKVPYPMLQTYEHNYTEETVKTNVPYPYWMEILEVEDGVETMAEFQLFLTEQGNEKLAAKGLDPTFPAAVCYEPASAAKRIYFAGDFADQVIPQWATRLPGSAVLLRYFTYLPGVPREHYFMWRWYTPVMKNIFQEGAN